MTANGYWHKTQRQRVSRRALLRGAAIGAAGAVALGATAPSVSLLPQRAAPAQAGEPVRGGRYVYAPSIPWGTIDPLTSVAGGPGIFPRIYNTLVDRSRQMPDFIFFDLAESFEQPDAETSIFSIRRGVEVAPNNLGIPERELTALDVTSWLDQIESDVSAILHAFTNLWLDSYAAPDAWTFEMLTTDPYAYTLFRLGSPLGGTIPPRELYGPGFDIANQGAGAGPWGTITPGSYTESGEIVLVRNPNYYRPAGDGGRLPYIDVVETVTIFDRQPRRAAFVDGQIYEYTAEDQDEVDDLLAIRPGLQVVENPVNTFISFVMNPTRPPWDDERIRRAALYALNRQEFVDKIVGEGGGRPNGLVHWPLGDFALPPEELEELQPYNPQMSRDLILEATGEERIKINVMYPVSDIEFHDRHWPVFVQQMSEAGFDINEEPQTFTKWLQNYAEVNYDASLALNQIYETPEIPLDFHAAQGPQGDGNFALGIGGIYPEVEDAIRASKTAPSVEEHIEAVRHAQRVIYEHAPAFLPIMSWIGFTLYQPFVRGIMPGLGNTGLYTTPLWWLDAGAPQPHPGEVDGDSDIDSIDASLSLQREAGRFPNLPRPENADPSGDGRTNSIDAALILQHSAGLVDLDA